jgi:uncharacterized membrane protein
MHRVLIITANCVLLVFLLIGLTIAAAANIVAALFLIKPRKQKIICWEWATVFAVLLLAFYSFTRGYFNFEWLKKILLWLQNHL